GPVRPQGELHAPVQKLAQRGHAAGQLGVRARAADRPEPALFEDPPVLLVEPDAVEAAAAVVVEAQFFKVPGRAQSVPLYAALILRLRLAAVGPDLGLVRTGELSDVSEQLLAGRVLRVEAQAVAH